MDVIKKLYFTDEAINDFLVNKLDFANWKIILHRDKLEFLTYLQQKHLVHVYFQNIGMAAVSAESRSLPTIEDIITTGLSGRGGPCFVLNSFIHLLLAALGFDTFVVRATITPQHTSPIAAVREDNHILAIIKLREDELYLIDVALAGPMDVPVPLHNLPHRGLAGGYSYEFRRHSLSGKPTSTHGRYRIGRPLNREISPASDDPQEVLHFEFDLVPRSLSYFERSMRPFFIDPNASANFLRRPFLFRYLKHEYAEPDDTEWVLANGLKIVLETKMERKVLQYVDYEEMKPDIWKHFPGLDKDEMKLAFELFEKAAAAGQGSAGV